MRIQSRHPTEGGRERVTVVPESLDDLWHLNHVIEAGDLVSGDTTRRIQRADDTMRDTGGEREPMRVTLEVEDAEFHKFANRLRVSGVIVACSREDQLSQHHTLNVEPLTEVEIEKVWKPDQDERLEEAEAARENPDVAVVTVEEGLAAVHTVSQYGTEEYASVTGPTGKGEYARPREELFDRLADVVEHLDVDALVVAGPGFTKHDALEYIQGERVELPETVRVVDTSGVGDRGVHEVLTRGVVDEIQSETRISEEAELIDELMRRIKAGERAVYGPAAVAEAAEFGAVETLLVLDARLREERGGGGEWEIDVDEVITAVEQQGGSVTVFSSDFEPGSQLSGLGGIAALLRYRLS